MSYALIRCRGREGGTFDPTALPAAEVEKRLKIERREPGLNVCSLQQRIQNTTDTLLDLTGRNVTDFLVKTFEDSGKTR